MTDIALLPCPHCGGGAELDTSQSYRALSDGSLGSRAVIYCTRCGADMGFCYEDARGTPREDIVNQVVDDWNRRSSPSQVAPANPAQVTDANLDYGLKLIAEAIDAHFGDRDDAYKYEMGDTTIHDVWEAYDALTAAIGAGGQVVEVKPLEWTVSNGDWYAGGYRVHVDLDGSPALYIVSGWHGAGTNPYGTLDEAQAAAQANHDAYIRSCLALSQPHPADERVEPTEGVSNKAVEGRKAYKAGQPKGSNPYSQGTARYWQWSSGWLDEQAFRPRPDERVVEALEWYAVQVAGCRKVTSEGNDARAALNNDGGERARVALSATEGR